MWAPLSEQDTPVQCVNHIEAGGWQAKVHAPNLVHNLFLQIKFYWNTARLTHLWLLSCTGEEWSSSAREHMVHKAKTFTIWSFTKMGVNPWSQQKHISVSSDPKDSLTFKKKSLPMCRNSAVLVLWIFHFLLSRREGRKEIRMGNFGVPMHLKRNQQTRVLET